MSNPIRIPTYPKSNKFQASNLLFEQTFYREKEILTLQDKIKKGLSALKASIVSYNGMDKQLHAENYNQLLLEYTKMMAALDNIVAYEVILRSKILSFNNDVPLKNEDIAIPKPKVNGAVSPQNTAAVKVEAKEETPFTVSEPVMTPNNLSITPPKVVVEDGKQ
jgi:hypothetical protein